jgi:flagellar motor protein MotB
MMTEQEEHAQRWVIPYADMLTLLLGAVCLMKLSPPAPLEAKEPPKPQKPVQKVAQQPVVPPTPSGVTVHTEPQGVVITVEEQLLFQPGQAVLDKRAQAVLDQLAQWLITQTGDIRVEGHTDNTPIETAQYPSNWELSSARALAIVQHLVHQSSLTPQRLSAVGYGEHRPVADNSTIEGKRKNRRVDIVLLKGNE